MAVAVSVRDSIARAATSWRALGAIALYFALTGFVTWLLVELGA